MKVRFIKKKMQIKNLIMIDLFKNIIANVFGTSAKSCIAYSKYND